MVLTDQQHEAAEFLAEGKNQAQVAAEIGVSERTVYRWLRLPEFQQRIAECREQNQQLAMLDHWKAAIKDMEQTICLLLDPAQPAKLKVQEANRLLTTYGDLA